MKKTGIWLDKKTAYIISEDGTGDQQLKIVISKIEDYNIHGGSGTRVKGGPQDVVQDRKYLEREKHQFKTYFEEITRYLRDSEEIVIFGPAESGEKFRKELKNSYKPIASKLSGVFTADSMTKNQIKALVRNYFKKGRSSSTT